jgi:hypothetical protein
MTYKLINKQTEITVRPILTYNGVNHPLNQTSNAPLMPLPGALHTSLTVIFTAMAVIRTVGAKESAAVNSAVNQ